MPRTKTLDGGETDLFKRQEEGYRGFFALGGNVEHYTPRFIWERAAQTMGAIDCDPASDENHNVPASVHYTKKENGLLQPWTGRIWLNPPFGREVWKWFEKLQGEKNEGRLLEAVVLWKTATETRGWKILSSMSSLICLPHRRIFFINKHFQGDGSTFSPALVYIGPNEERFIEAFSDIGDIWRKS